MMEQEEKKPDTSDRGTVLREVMESKQTQLPNSFSDMLSGSWLNDLLFMEHPWKDELKKAMEKQFNEFYEEFAEGANERSIELKNLLRDMLYRQIKNAIEDNLETYTIKKYRRPTGKEKQFPDYIPYRELDLSKAEHLLSQTFFLPTILLTVQNRGSLKKDIRNMKEQQERERKLKREEQKLIDTYFSTWEATYPNKPTLDALAKKSDKSKAFWSKKLNDSYFLAAAYKKAFHKTHQAKKGKEKRIHIEQIISDRLESLNEKRVKNKESTFINKVPHEEF